MIFRKIEPLKKKSADVKVSITFRPNTSKTEQRTTIVFRNYSIEKISKTKYLAVYLAAPEPRIYFEESEKAGGWRIQRAGENPSIRKVYIEEILADFVGEYFLEYDETEQKYYIDQLRKVDAES